MGIYIPGMKMPKACVYRENGHFMTCPLYDIDGYCGALNKEAKHDLVTKLCDCPLVPVPEFSDIGSDPDDVWKKIFTLVVLLLSDREKFDKLKDDILADMEE